MQTSAFQFQTAISSSNTKALWLAKGRPEICFALPAFITTMITSNFLLHSAVQRYVYYFMYCSIFLDIFHSIMVLLLGSSVPCYWRRSRLIVFCAFRDNSSKLKEVGTESNCLIFKSPACRLVVCFLLPLLPLKGQEINILKFYQRKKKERKTKSKRVPFFNLTTELGFLKLLWFKTYL